MTIICLKVNDAAKRRKEVESTSLNRIEVENETMDNDISMFRWAKCPAKVHCL